MVHLNHRATSNNEITSDGVTSAHRSSAKLRPPPQVRSELAEPAAPYPQWLEQELRSDHAGETGAVWIYRGVLSVTRDPGIRAFAQRHLKTEQRHLGLLENLLLARQRSRLVPIWRIAGFLTGALPALIGARAVYATVAAVETFVDRHYAQQIERLEPDGRWSSLRETLETCRLDEVSHRDESRDAAGDIGPAIRTWCYLVAVGSAAAVALARRI